MVRNLNLSRFLDTHVDEERKAVDHALNHAATHKGPGFGFFR